MLAIFNHLALFRSNMSIVMVVINQSSIHIMIVFKYLSLQSKMASSSQKSSSRAGWNKRLRNTSSSNNNKNNFKRLPSATAAASGDVEMCPSSSLSDNSGNQDTHGSLDQLADGLAERNRIERQISETKTGKPGASIKKSSYDKVANNTYSDSTNYSNETASTYTSSIINSERL